MTFVATLGRRFLALLEIIGGLMLLFVRILRALVPPSFDRRETWRNLYKVGVQSYAIVAVTGFFAGAIMVIQTGDFIGRTGATGLLGWGAGFAVLAEIGPVLIGLMFSGRVGANNTAELGTMAVTEQLDALRSLAIEPIRYLVVPRFMAMMVMLGLLTCIGDLCALFGGALASQWILKVHWRVFYYGIIESHLLREFLVGILKAACFGLSISVVSCYFGLRVSGGASGVGRAVNQSVVASAIGIWLVDLFVTWATYL